MEYNNKRKQNTLDNIYKKLKKSHEFKSSYCYEIVKSFYGNNCFGKMRKFRAFNVHDLSVHLDDKFKLDNSIVDEINSIYYIDKDKKRICSSISKEKINDIDSKINKNTNNEIKILKKDIINNIKWFEKIFVECIDIYKERILNRNIEIYIKQKSLYSWYINKKKIVKKLNKKSIIKYIDSAKELFEQGRLLRETIRERCSEINMNPNLIYERPPTLQIMSYYIDVLFRFVEVIRSILESLHIFVYGNHEFIDVNLTGTTYYFYSALLKLYGCFEKTGKLIYVLFEIKEYKGDRDDLKNKYFETVVNLSREEKFNFLPPIKMISAISSKPEYKKYIKTRDKIFHGIRPEFIITDDEFNIFYINNIGNLLENAKLLLNLLKSIDISVKKMHETAKRLDKENLKTFLDSDYYFHLMSILNNK